MSPNAGLALGLLVDLLTRAQATSALIQNAQLQGRDVSNEELDRLVVADNDAKARLDAAIAAARTPS